LRPPVRLGDHEGVATAVESRCLLLLSHGTSQDPVGQALRACVNWLAMPVLRAASAPVQSGERPRGRWWRPEGRAVAHVV